MVEWAAAAVAVTVEVGAVGATAEDMVAVVMAAAAPVAGVMEEGLSTRADVRYQLRSQPKCQERSHRASDSGSRGGRRCQMARSNAILSLTGT